MRRTLAFLVPWMAAGPALLAQAPPAPHRLPTAYGLWENDGGFIKPNHNEDKHYTNGVLFGVAHHPRWADDLAAVVPDLGGGFGQAPATAAGYFVGQQMFTPDDIEAFGVIEDDRPFAGYSFAGAYWQRATPAGNPGGVDTFDHLQVEVGVIGDWSQAERIQEAIHDWYDGDEPNGWDNQLENEVTVQIHTRRKWRIPLNPIELGDSLRLDGQLIPHVGLALGTVHRYLEGAATLRIGVNLPDDFGPARISDLPAATGPAPRGWSVYGFGQVLARAVEYNHFLEGSDFQDETHTVEEEPLVGEFTAGAVLGYRGEMWEAALRYSQTFLTEEFKAQTTGDDYATLSVSLGARF